MVEAAGVELIKGHTDLQRFVFFLKALCPPKCPLRL